MIFHILVKRVVLCWSEKRLECDRGRYGHCASGSGRFLSFISMPVKLGPQKLAKYAAAHFSEPVLQQEVLVASLGVMLWYCEGVAP